MNSAPQAAPTSSRFAGIIGERMRRMKGAALGVAMGKSEDWARKVLDGDQGIRLEDLSGLLEVLGLKAVDREKVCVDPDVAKSLQTIARKALNAHDLIWDDAE